MVHIGRMAPADDGTKVERGAGEALEELRAPLEAYFRRRVRQSDDVPDLVQDVYLRLSSRGSAGDSVETIDNLRGYVFQIAASVLADRQRRRAVRHSDAHVELDSDRLAAPEPPAERVVAARQELSLLLAALDRLPERTRAIFILRRIEGMAYRDIAQSLGITVSAVEKHMARAVVHLAKAGARR